MSSSANLKLDASEDVLRGAADSEDASNAQERGNPEERAGLVSCLLFAYLTPLLRLSRTRTLKKDDIWPMARGDDCKSNALLLECHRPPSASQKVPAGGARAAASWLVRAVFHVYRSDLLSMTAFMALERCTQVVQPLVLEALLLWMEDESKAAEMGYLYAAAMFLLSLVGALLGARFYHAGTRVFVQVRGAVSHLVYRKALSVRHIGISRSKSGGDGDGSGGAGAGDEQATTGKVVNLMSVDAEKIAQMMFSFSNIVVVPVQVAVLVWLIYETIGSATWAGLAVFVVFLPPMAYVFKNMFRLHVARLTKADSRVKLTNEVLQGIRVVKFQAWELSFEARLGGIRELELSILRSYNFFQTSITFLFLLLPVSISLVAFSVYTSLGNELETATLFRALALINALQWPMVQLPSAASSILMGMASVKRIERFLGSESEYEIQAVATGAGAEPANADLRHIAIRDCHFHWTREGTCQGEDSSAPDDDDGGNDGGGNSSRDPAGRPFCLQVGEFLAREGQLTAVIGSVASGKSALLSACLGDMHMLHCGEILRPRKIGYVAQSSWIQNMSLRDNILFGAPFDQQRYDAVIEMCGLQQDLDMLEAGDLSEIGERGLNLSGGQKARVSLARAVYSDAEVILMDSVLSAVDASLLEHIFTKCLTGELMKNRTRVLVTSQLHVLKRCDYLFVMEDGRISASGTYDDLKREGTDFAALIQRHADRMGGSSRTLQANSSRSNDGDAAGGAESDSNDDSNNSSSSGKRIDAKMSQTTEVETQSKKKKAKGQPGQLLDEEEIYQGDVSVEAYRRHFAWMGGMARFYFPVFACDGVAQACLLCSTVLLAYWAEDKYDKSDSWYIGAYALFITMSAVFLLVRGFMFAIASVRASRAYHESVLHSILRAPAAFFDVTPTGRILNRFGADIDAVDIMLPNVLNNALSLTTILCANFVLTSVIAPPFIVIILLAIFLFGKIQVFFKQGAIQVGRIHNVSRSPVYRQFAESLRGNATIRAFDCEDRFIATNRALLDTSSQVFFIARLCFRWALLRVGLLNAAMLGFLSLIIVIQRDSIDAGLAGVALTLTLGASALAGFLVIIVTEVHSQMNAAERLWHYASNVDQEPAWELPDDPDPAVWPSQGGVEISDVVVKYRAGLEPALDGVTASMCKEFVGVCGRSGSGKSTLISTLTRLYDAESGRIVVDGVDISTVGLHALRRAIACVPQDPVLFSGTVRANLDPFSEHSDPEIWAALEKLGLDKAVESLQDSVDEYGGNFSHGQRQLLSMARALLKPNKPKIVLLDEATSNLDHETDAKLQSVLRQEFADATVIVVAHRISTVLDASNLLVLDKGRVVEHGKPGVLLQAGGAFSELHEKLEL